MGCSAIFKDLRVRRLTLKLKMTLLSISAASLWVSTSALAVMPPQAYLSARASAPTHVQIKINSVSHPLSKDNLANCQVSGIIVKRFRGKLKPRTPITVSVACDSTPTATTGGALFIRQETLQRGEFAEIFLTDESPPKVVLDQFHIVPAPSNSPRCRTTKWKCH